MIYIFLSNNPSSGDINSSNLSCSNNDPRLTLTHLTSRSNLLPNALKREISEKLIFLILLKPKSLFLLDLLKLMRQWL